MLSADRGSPRRVIRARRPSRNVLGASQLKSAGSCSDRVAACQKGGLGWPTAPAGKANCKKVALCPALMK
jgi:hypothetical protein